MIQGVDGVGADVTALGDSVNTAARLVAQAGPGEIILSDATYAAAGLDLPGLERRQLQLKGKSECVDVRVSRADGATSGLSIIGQLMEQGPVPGRRQWRREDLYDR